MIKRIISEQLAHQPITNLYFYHFNTNNVIHSEKLDNKFDTTLHGNLYTQNTTSYFKPTQDGCDLHTHTERS